MRSSPSSSRARTSMRVNDGSSLVRPTRNSWTSNSPPSSTTRSNTRRRMSESIRCPSSVSVSRTVSAPGRLLEARQREALLRLVLPLLVGVGDLARLVALEEQELRDALAGVDARGQRRRVRDLERDDALPLGLERGDVHDDP